MSENDRKLELTRTEDHWVGRFQAMAGPCMILTDAAKRAEALHISEICAREAWRIEDKYSRYLKGNVVDLINRSRGAPVRVDEETANLIDFAYQLHSLSGGLFDITSGALREVWRFDGSDRIPGSAAVNKLMTRIGLEKLSWNKSDISLPKGMEIDFGGIAKEYAVDRAASLLNDETDASAVVNFGGDLRVSRAPSSGRPWRVGIENSPTRIDLRSGAIATSGDANRFLEKGGVRYSHILNPTTGWPVEGAPHSVTVAADTCTQAGMLSTMAMLRGPDAEAFLGEQSVQFWCTR